MKKCVLLVALLLNTNLLFAQAEFLIELEPSTGVLTKIGGPIPGVGWIYPGVRTYDAVNGRFIFRGGNPIPDRLYSLDIADGSVLANPFMPVAGTTVVSAPQFDNSSSTLFGLVHINNSAYYLATIDPVSGQHTQVGTNAITGLGGLIQGMDTYDEINQRYMIYSGNILYSIDAQTGNTLTNPQLVLQPGFGIIHICYNNTNDTLYGLMMESNSQIFSLVWIDPATGVVTPIGNSTSLAAGNGSATIDEVNRRFMYSYSSQSGFYLSVLSLVTGDIVFNNQIGVLQTQDNVHNLRYDNVRQRLFAVHWDADAPLKINLADFDAQYKGGSMAAISWKALGCEGDEQFEVEHSRDGKTFTTIAKLSAEEGRGDYSIDHHMVEGSNFYRLRIKEINGQVTYSQVVRLLQKGLFSSLELLPNLVTSQASLHISANGGEQAELLVYDASGRQVYKSLETLHNGSNTLLLQLSSLAAGTYTLQVKLNSEPAVPLKFVKL